MTFKNFGCSLTLVFAMAVFLMGVEQTHSNPSNKTVIIDKQKKLAIKRQRQKARRKQECRKKYSRLINSSTKELRMKRRNLNKEYTTAYNDALNANKEYVKLIKETKKLDKTFSQLSKDEKQKVRKDNKKKFKKILKIEKKVSDKRALKAIKEKIKALNLEIMDKSSLSFNNDDKCKEMLLQLKHRKK